VTILTKKQTDRQTDRQAGRQTDRQTDGQTNRQTDRSVMMAFTGFEPIAICLIIGRKIPSAMGPNKCYLDAINIGGEMSCSSLFRMLIRLRDTARDKQRRLRIEK
jgi:hypothetical protein